MTNTAALQSEYPSVMENAVSRLVAAEQCHEELTGNPTHPDSWKNCDFIALQVRKLCELMLLGSTLAHWREGTAEINPNKWRPKEAFGELSQLSNHPLQVPVAIQLHQEGQGQHQAQPPSKGILGSFAEFEADIRRERQMEGIAKAKAAGVYKIP